MSIGRVLLVKTSSLGDVIHTFPALSDALAALPGVHFDWVVEEAYAELPRWHPAVERVIPVAIRRWRRQPWRAWRSGEWAAFRAALAERRYERVIDAQGLLKSALITRLVDAPHAGFDAASARERLAAHAYQHSAAVPRELHAIERTRRLFAALLGYPLPADAPRYALALSPSPSPAGGRGELEHPSPACGRGAGGEGETRTLLFLHGSTRAEKCWPEAHWRRLCELAGASGERVLLPWGNAAEHARATRLAGGFAHVEVLPRLSLADIATLMQPLRAVVAVDTGLGHLAAALGVPCVSLYGPTQASRIGTAGLAQRHLAAADGQMATITPQAVWQALGEWLP